MKKLARVVDTEGIDEMYLYTKNITKPLSNASVAVDDDPEEAAGGETVGRTRRGLEQDLEQAGQVLEQAPGRVSEEFATVLEEFESAVSVPAEETSIYLESADKSADGLGPFFLECWQMSLKFLRLVPIQQLEGAWLGDPIKTPILLLHWPKTL